MSYMQGMKVKTLYRSVKFKKDGCFPKVRKAGKVLVYAKTMKYNPKTMKGKVKYQFIDRKDWV